VAVSRSLWKLAEQPDRVANLDQSAPPTEVSTRITRIRPTVESFLAHALSGPHGRWCRGCQARPARPLESSPTSKLRWGSVIEPADTPSRLRARTGAGPPAHDDILKDAPAAAQSACPSPAVRQHVPFQRVNRGGDVKATLAAEISRSRRGDRFRQTRPEYGTATQAPQSQERP
jgi:hypothetical protein